MHATLTTTLHTGQGHRSDLASLAELVGRGASNREIAEAMPGSYLQYARGVQDLRDALDVPDRDVNFNLRPWQVSPLLTLQSQNSKTFLLPGRDRPAYRA